MQTVDVAILGAGAAGLMCAFQAGQRGRRVLLLDHADRPGKKILISGGGRCNFTNLHTAPEHFLSQNPHFARSALARFTPADMVALVEKHHIPYHEKTLGQLFCDHTSRDILSLLERECAAAHVRLQLETRIHTVTRNAASPHRFTLDTSAGPVHAGSVVVATGGLSIPRMGATGLGYDLARHFGLRIVEPRPGLVPFTFAPADHAAWSDLAGVSAEVAARLAPLSTARKRSEAPAPTFREKLLITHRGLSGPAILQISSFCPASGSIVLDMAPGRQLFAPLLAPHARRDAAAALALLRTLLPTRWAERWLTRTLPPPWPPSPPSPTPPWSPSNKPSMPGNSPPPHRGLRQSRSHRRRRRHRRASSPDPRMPQSPRPLLHRRSRRRHRLARRLQLPMGLASGVAAGQAA